MFLLSLSIIGLDQLFLQYFWCHCCQTTGMWKCLAFQGGYSNLGLCFQGLCVSGHVLFVFPVFTMWTFSLCVNSDWDFCSCFWLQLIKTHCTNSSSSWISTLAYKWFEVHLVYTGISHGWYYTWGHSLSEGFILIFVLIFLLKLTLFETMPVTLCY